jgi:multidrug efflux pump subunit AcrA (membrane-fusion protein)
VNARASRQARLAARAVIQGTACFAALLSGCRKQAAPGAPPPPEVTVLTVQRQTIPGQYEWVAQAAASKSVQIRAQVSGVIIERPYVEGTDVPKGKVLFRVDPRTYHANYQSAKARMAEAEAQFANAERTLNRLKPLLEERAVAQQDVDNAQAAYDQAHAAVLSFRDIVSRWKLSRSTDPTRSSRRCSGPAGRRASGSRWAWLRRSDPPAASPDRCLVRRSGR